MFGLILEIALLAVFKVEANAALVIASLGLAVTAVAFGSGSTLIDAIKAWRG